MKNDLKDRTKGFALRILKMATFLPHTQEGNIIRGQIIRCGTSTASNYRAACRAQSLNTFLAKMSIVEEEIDETAFWLEIIIERKLIKQELLKNLLYEAYELVAITVSSKKTARKSHSD